MLKKKNIKKCLLGFKHHLKLNVAHCDVLMVFKDQREGAWLAHSRERLITYVCSIYQQTLEGARPSVKVTHIHRAAHQA